MIYPVLLVSSDGIDLLYTRPRRRPPDPPMLHSFIEGTMTSLYPGGQWVSRSFWHHVSVNRITSTSLIDFMNSGFPLFSWKVVEWRPWIVQYLIWNYTLKTIKINDECRVIQIWKHLPLSIYLQYWIIIWHEFHRDSYYFHYSTALTTTITIITTTN